MPPAFTLKPDDVNSAQKRAQFTICIVGCGAKGIAYSLAFAEAGFKVTCTDADQSLIRRLSKGNIHLQNRQQETKLKGLIRKDQISVTSDAATAFSTSDIIILTLNPKIDNKSIQNNEVQSACKKVGAALKPGILLIYAGVAGIGFTESIVKETVENTSGLKAGESFGLAYQTSLLSLSEGNFGEQESIVAANDKLSLNAAAAIFECVAKKAIKKTPSIKLGEAAALFVGTKFDVNLALGNELAMLCENANLDYMEALHLIEDAAVQELKPSILEEHQKETYLLLENAEAIGFKLRLPTLTRQINQDMIRHAINLTQDALRACGGTLRRSKIALIGSAESQNAVCFAAQLENKGAKISLYDYNHASDENRLVAASAKKTLNEAIEGTDCIVVFSGQEQLGRNLKKLRALMKSPASIVDLAGAVEPQKVEAEGFIYRGLGRGVYKK